MITIHYQTPSISQDPERDPPDRHRQDGPLHVLQVQATPFTVSIQLQNPSKLISTFDRELGQLLNVVSTAEGAVEWGNLGIPDNVVMVGPYRNYEGVTRQDVFTALLALLEGSEWTLTRVPFGLPRLSDYKPKAILHWLATSPTWSDTNADVCSNRVDLNQHTFDLVVFVTLLRRAAATRESMHVLFERDEIFINSKVQAYKDMIEASFFARMNGQDYPRDDEMLVCRWKDEACVLYAQPERHVRLEIQRRALERIAAKDFYPEPES